MYKNCGILWAAIDVVRQKHLEESEKLAVTGDQTKDTWPPALVTLYMYCVQVVLKALITQYVLL